MKLELEIPDEMLTREANRIAQYCDDPEMIKATLAEALLGFIGPGFALYVGRELDRLWADGAVEG